MKIINQPIQNAQHILFYALFLLPLIVSAQDESSIRGFQKEKALSVPGGDTEVYDGALIPFDTLTNVYVGDVAYNNEGVFNHEAYFWRKDKFGYVYQSTLLLSSQRDEVAVGVAILSPTQYVTVIHQSDSYLKDSVQLNDNVLMALVDTAGNEIWTAEYVIEEGGIAPTDVLIGGPEGTIFILVNKIENGITSTGFLEYSSSGTLLGASQFYNGGTIGSFSHEFLETPDENLLTISYSYDQRNSEAVVFEITSRSLASVVSLDDAGAPSRFYGVSMDSNGPLFYTAGYTGDHGDTIATILELDNTLSIQNQITLDSSGTYSSYRDITVFDRTVAAAGVCDNCGPNNTWSLVVSSYDKSMNIRFSRIIDRGSSLSVNSVLNLNGSQRGEFLNALGRGYDNPPQPLSGGLWNFASYLNRTVGSFRAPRIVFMADLVCEKWFNGEWGPSADQDHEGVDCDMPRMADPKYYDDMVNQFREFNIVFLYDVDIINVFAEQQQTKDALNRFIHKLQRSGKKVGMILGENQEVYDQLIQIMDAQNNNSIFKYGDIDFVMLEHEFWSTQMQPDPNLPLFGSSATPSTPEENYWVNAKQHLYLLSQIDNRVQKYVNYAKVFDYIDNPSYIVPNTLNGNSRDLSASTYNSASIMYGISAQMKNYFDQSDQYEDYTFFLYYRNVDNPNIMNWPNNTGDNINFNIDGVSGDQTSSTWYIRNQAYAAVAISKQRLKRQIPLHSMEGEGETDCFRYTGTCKNCWGHQNNARAGWNQDLDLGIVGQKYQDVNGTQDKFDLNFAGHWFVTTNTDRDALSDLEYLWFLQYNVNTNPAFVKRSTEQFYVVLPAQAYYQLDHYLYVRQIQNAPDWVLSENETRSDDRDMNLSW